MCRFIKLPNSTADFPVGSLNVWGSADLAHSFIFTIFDRDIINCAWPMVLGVGWNCSGLLSTEP